MFPVIISAEPDELKFFLQDFKLEEKTSAALLGCFGESIKAEKSDLPASVWGK